MEDSVRKELSEMNFGKDFYL